MGWAGQSSAFNPKQTSKKSSEWFQYKDINVIKYHEWSPDPDPIEHLWQQLKWQLNANEVPPAGCHELWEQMYMG
jgi:hypothetical protein